MKNDQVNTFTILTAGSNYLDIDAYACMVAMAELLKLNGKNAIAYSTAPCNYSVCESLVYDGQILRELPLPFNEKNANYIVVDVSDPEFLNDSIPLERVVGVYDHHVGFENYWKDRIGESARIDFIGAAATLIYREWKKAGREKEISRSTALLLIAAILDNTLNLTSANTTKEDIEVFNELCKRENITQEWCASYFTEVQKSVEKDLRNAIFNDIKTVKNNPVLPLKVSQLCVWDASSILEKLSEIRLFFRGYCDSWMINIIDIQHHCSYFVCDDNRCQKEIGNVFDVGFEMGVAKTEAAYLRKEIIKKTMH